MPGPGAYKIEKDFISKNNVPIGKKYKPNWDNLNPGPGTYNSDVKFYSSKLNCFMGGKFDREKKGKKFENFVPGPDKYFDDSSKLYDK